MAVGLFVLVFGGILADHYGRKMVLVFSAFLGAIGYFMVSVAVNWYWILFAILFWRISEMSDLAVSALIADSTKLGTRGVSYAALNLLPGIPSFMAPYLAGLTISRFGFKHAMFLMGVIGVLVYLISAVAYTVVKETRNDLFFNGKEGYHTKPQSFMDFLKPCLPKNLGPQIKWLFLVAALFAVAEEAGGLLIAVYSLFVIGVPPYEWGLLQSIATAAVIPLSLILGRAVDRLGTPILLSLLVISTSSSFLIAVTSAPAIILAAYFALYVANTSAYTAMDAFLGEWAPAPLRGRVFGGLRLVSTFVTLAISPFIGFVYEKIAFQLPFIIASTAYFLATITVVVLTKIEAHSY